MSVARLLALMLLGGLTACSRSKQAGACAIDDMACLQAAALRHSAREIETWRDHLARPLDQRIGPAPQVLVDYLRIDNLRNGLAQRPRVAAADEAFVADLRAAFAELPETVRRSVEPKLIGIYLVDDLGGSGFADQVLDGRGEPVAAFVVLDRQRLSSLTANAWASWKESTPFKAVPGHTLRAEIETAAHDDRVHAIQYILLHELAHVVATGARFHPNWNLPPAQVEALDRYPFFNLSWQRSADGQRFLSKFDERFAQRPRVVYYAEPKLAAYEMAATYAGLQQTNFATLYAATNPTDDFAESYANYVHTVMMGRPFAIHVDTDDKPAMTYTACWQEPRCAAKRALLVALLTPSPA